MLNESASLRLTWIGLRKLQLRAGVCSTSMIGASVALSRESGGIKRYAIGHFCRQIPGKQGLAAVMKRSEQVINARFDGLARGARLCVDVRDVQAYQGLHLDHVFGALVLNSTQMHSLQEARPRWGSLCCEPSVMSVPNRTVTQCRSRQMRAVRIQERLDIIDIRLIHLFIQVGVLENQCCDASFRSIQDGYDIGEELARQGPDFGPASVDEAVDNDVGSVQEQTPIRITGRVVAAEFKGRRRRRPAGCSREQGDSHAGRRLDSGKQRRPSLMRSTEPFPLLPRKRRPDHEAEGHLGYRVMIVNRPKRHRFNRV